MPVPTHFTLAASDLPPAAALPLLNHPAPSKPRTCHFKTTLPLLNHLPPCPFKLSCLPLLNLPAPSKLRCWLRPCTLTSAPPSTPRPATYQAIENSTNKSVGLPSWEAERPRQSCDRLQASSWSAEGQWYKDRAGLYRYEPDTCSLKRFTADEARQCFAGNSVAFVGDSLTRWLGGRVVCVVGGGGGGGRRGDLQSVCSAWLAGAVGDWGGLDSWPEHCRSMPGAVDRGWHDNKNNIPDLCV